MFRKTKRLICLALTLTLMLSMAAWPGTVVSAEETVVQPRYSYTESVITGLSINSSGTATCTAKATGYSDTTKIEIEMKLQKYTLLWWSTQQTWTTTVNDSTARLTKTKSVGSGTYRVIATYTVYKGSKSETIEGQSAEKKYSA